MKRLTATACLLLLAGCVQAERDLVRSDGIVYRNVITELDIQAIQNDASAHCAQDGRVANLIRDGVPDGRVLVRCE